MTGSSLAGRATLVGMLALLVAALLPLATASAQDERVVDLDVAEGEDNVGVAIRISQYTFAGAAEALIGRDDLFADSLASGSLQGGGRPLLLTAADALDERVVDELNRLGVTTVHILGGEEAVSADVAADIEAAGFTVGERFEGATRTETAIDIAEFVNGDTFLLARSHPAFADPATSAFVDALAAGGWAAEQGWPILFTYPPGEDDPATPDIDESALGETLTESTAAAIEAGGFSNAIIIGGTAAVSQAVEDQLEGMVDSVERVGGANRAHTAVLIAEARGWTDSNDPELTIVADGEGGDAWVDGFAGAALSGLTPGPIVLDDSAEDSLPPETAEFLVPFEADAPPAGFAQDPGAEFELNDHSNDHVVCLPGANDCALVGEEVELPVDVEGPPSGVTFDPTTLEAGGEVTITIPGLAEGDVITVTGCGFEEGDFEQTVAAGDIDEDGNVVVAVAVPAPGTDAEETCTLTVSVNGEAVESQEITVTLPPANQGVITLCRPEGDRFLFSNATESVIVNYLAADTFTIDGHPATLGAFEAPASGCSPGDQVVVTVNADGTQTIALTNVDPESINSGTIGNIDIANNEFDIIDPVTGSELRVDVDYTGAVYTTDGAPVTESGFEADLHEGDTIVITPAAGATPATFALTNQTTTGVASGGFFAGEVEIGWLGDDPASAANDFGYPYAGPEPTTYSVDGTAADLAAFEAALTIGDTLSVSRNDGAWVFALTNVAHLPRSGDLTDEFDPFGVPPAPGVSGGTATLMFADSDSESNLAYTASAVFVVDGALATEAEFEAALSAGDDITYQAGDPGTGTLERLTLVNDTLNNNCSPAAAGDPEVCSIPDDLVDDSNPGQAGTFDVVNPAGGVIYDDFDYGTGGTFGGPVRYFVDGTEVGLTPFEVNLMICTTVATANCSVEVVRTALATEVRLDTDTTV